MSPCALPSFLVPVEGGSERGCGWHPAQPPALSTLSPTGLKSRGLGLNPVTPVSSYHGQGLLCLNSTVMAKGRVQLTSQIHTHTPTLEA